MPSAGAKNVQFKGFQTNSVFEKSRQDVGEKPSKVGEMYPIKWPGYTQNDVEKRIGGVLGPLSLFAPYPHEDISEEKEETVLLERPVTPIDREIKCQPTSLDQLSKFVRRRISAKPDVPYLNTEDQHNLAAILMGEITLLWPEIKKQIDDPFLSPEENKELNRRIAVHIVTVCESLFNHYLKKAQVLNERGIFSGPANMSRLKAQLALDANKFLNVLTIRRYIVADIRGKKDEESDDQEEYIYTSSKPLPRGSAAPLSFKNMIKTSRPKSKTKKFRFHTPEHEAKAIADAMPSLDTNKLMSLIAGLPERDLETPVSESDANSSRMSADDHHPSGSPLQIEKRGLTQEEISRQKVLLKRSCSMPQLQIGENLLEEIGVSVNVKKDLLHEVELNYLKRQRAIIQDSQVSSKEKHKDAKAAPQPGSRAYIANDLKQLVNRSHEVQDSKVEEDLPPLLQAITNSSKQDGTKEKIEKQIKELEEKEKREIEEERIVIREPTHPQPATVSAKLPGMEVRASDVRVSERVCMSSLTINRYSTVYNDLSEEIDPPTVKNLDKNLFLSDEIKEVYKEIMKTVPTSHLLLDDDELVVPAADTVNLSGTQASASLARRKVDRVINPAFQRGVKAPWGSQSQKQWVRTPNNPPKNFLGEDTFQPLTPNMEKVHDIMHNPSKMSTMLQTENMPRFVAEKMQRTYASWLQWWKSTITSDDYMKYLSTTETDYLGSVFHFYDSEDDDDEEDTPRAPALYTLSHPQSNLLLKGLTNQQRASPRGAHSSKAREIKNRRVQILPVEKEKKINELKKEKNKYENGMWNVNAVLMGGLGKDPVLEDEDDDSKRQKSADTSRSAKTLQERVAARHSAKLQEKAQRDVVQSRASKMTSATGTTSKLDTDRSADISPDLDMLSPQERLEKVWTLLEMPDNLKLDMAIKYSTDTYYTRILEAIEHWEKVTDLILKREELLGKLEKFERAASDPNRFFEKGDKGSSAKRLDEARQRSYYYKN
ncbi:hypothetical protein KUTeg_018120 [Tegillarca granosa]|uniref:Coiled-coil domain-containing protein 87 n=1 Tax=Tegillarca granosa TaxID=220873 RepID=A0ABQ9EGX4_TEGGR|nr:hypothetical protein KUTeg_018120 [Tegillarca granosa]